MADDGHHGRKQVPSTATGRGGRPAPVGS
jgi:hypothetical protein